MSETKDGETIATKVQIKAISETFREVADAYASEMIEAGADAQMAGSVVANIMLREA